MLVGPEAEEPVLALAGRLGGTRAGVSDPLAPEGGRDPAGAADLRTGLHQADRALDAARRQGRPMVRFAELAGQGLHDLVPAADAAGFAESLLRPLVRHDARRRGELVRSVREWLAHHGQWDPAASALGVHRHTLRARIDRAARLLGRDLDSPGVRAELWFALQVPRQVGSPEPG
ncbi:MAG: helix-turn-helix domain-containing protein [Pseudonocardia sp.]|nr:helix-turn-helix domain-containing protein [Pseudonocardia sp.]